MPELLSSKGVYPRAWHYRMQVGGLLIFFAGGAFLGLLIRKRPVFLASAVTAITIFFLILYAVLPSAWSAWIESSYRLNEVISYFLSSPAAYSASFAIGALLAFAALPRGHKRQKTEKAQKEVKVLP